MSALCDGTIGFGANDYLMERGQNHPPLTGEPITVLPFSRDGKTGRALIVHSPGNNSLEVILRGALADGLRTRGWQIDITALKPPDFTPSTGYDFVVLAAPVRVGHAARLLLDYTDHAQGLSGKPVFLILVGSGHSAEAMTELRNHAAAAGCNILEAIELDVGEAELTSSKVHDLEAVMRRAAERLAFVRRPIAARTY